MEGGISRAPNAPHAWPKSSCSVASVETRGFHYDMEQSAGNQCYHWNNNAQSYWHMGQALGKAFLGLL